ncbi:hypothetical protein GCM10020219_104730 [Nonomuraea dietziae]
MLAACLRGFGQRLEVGVVSGKPLCLVAAPHVLDEVVEQVLMGWGRRRMPVGRRPDCGIA